MLKKLIFLFKSNTNFKIILLFCYQKILNLFSKNKIKEEKKYFKNLIKNLKVSSDFFSVNAYNFYKNLSLVKKDFHYLEIGSYEGGSAIYVSSRFKSSNIYCVDNWTKTEDGYQNIDFNEIEENFDYNTKNLKNILKIKKSSDEFFLQNELYFEVIYIDGYHKASQVYKDCINSWKFLKSNGILIFDDYIWNHHVNINDNPCFAINNFLNKINNKYDILEVSKSQLFIRKTM